ncbi:DUF1385 domain-containing protein [bacterium]|nr:DUF1385 domain-containing protein [bacterium]
MAEEKHFYGGQAIMEGVMMRGTDSWGAAVQRKDGTIGVISQRILDFTHKHRWAKWPLVRGNVALVDTLMLGLRSLIFSFNVLVEEQQQLDREAAEKEAAQAEAEGKHQKPPKKQSDMGWAIWLALLPSMLIGLGLFILLPAALVKLLLHDPSDLVKNLIEGVVRLCIILGYIASISAMSDIRRLFQYHGAEHATINCYEAGEPVTLENCRRYSPLHPRCGTAFLLVFIVVKILVGAVLPYPDVMWQLMLLRILMIPIVAAIAYEIIRYGGRHRTSLLSRAMAQPGLLMQRLTTRHPSEEQIRVAIYALSTVAPEVPLPDGFPAPLGAAMDGKLSPESPATAVAAAE